MLMESVHAALPKLCPVPLVICGIPLYGRGPDAPVDPFSTTLGRSCTARHAGLRLHLPLGGGERSPVRRVRSLEALEDAIFPRSCRTVSGAPHAHHGTSASDWHLKNSRLAGEGSRSETPPVRRQVQCLWPLQADSLLCTPLPSR